PVAAVLERATRPDPAGRYGSARELKQALAAAAAQCGRAPGEPVGQEAVAAVVARLRSAPKSTLALDGALQSILGGALASEPVAESPIVVRPARREPRRRVGLSVALVGVALLLGVAAAQLPRGGSEEAASAIAATAAPSSPAEGSPPPLAADP